MRRLKARWLYAGLLALVALAWPFAPQIAAQTKFTWNSLEWDTYVEGHSIVYDKVGGDTAYFNVYENAAPGVEVGDNEPGDCNATDGYLGVLWYDTAGADSGLKWCNNEDGSYNWDALALDADRDGFSTSIDSDDFDDTVFARNLTAANVRDGTEIGPTGDVILTGTLVYRTQANFSGTAAQVNDQSTMRYLRAFNESDASTINHNRAQVFMGCVSKGYRDAVSWVVTSGSNATRAGVDVDFKAGGAQNRASELGYLLLNPNSTAAQADIWQTTSWSRYISSYSCYGFSS